MILRLGQIYGPGEEAHEKLVPQTILALLRGAAPAIHGDGSAQRELLFVTDAVEAIVRAPGGDARSGPLAAVRGPRG